MNRKGCVRTENTEIHGSHSISLKEHQQDKRQLPAELAGQLVSGRTSVVVLTEIEFLL